MNHEVLNNLHLFRICGCNKRRLTLLALSFMAETSYWSISVLFSISNDVVTVRIFLISWQGDLTQSLFAIQFPIMMTQNQLGFLLTQNLIKLQPSRGFHLLMNYTRTCFLFTSHATSITEKKVHQNNWNEYFIIAIYIICCLFIWRNESEIDSVPVTKLNRRKSFAEIISLLVLVIKHHSDVIPRS